MGRFLTKEQRKELMNELEIEDVAEYAYRYNTIRLLDDGCTYKEISEAFFLDEEKVANYHERYKKGELEGLINDKFAEEELNIELK